jgi:hypothetical protein
MLDYLKTNYMDTNIIGYWDKKKMKLKQKYKILTDKDLHYNEGKEEEMIQMLENKLGKTRQELLNIIVEL